MRNYTIRLQKYGVSDMRVRELESFCYQYHEKKKRLGDLLHSMPSAHVSGMPRGSGISDPTARTAVLIATENLMRDIEDMEAAAREAAEASGEGEVMGRYLLQYVTRRKKPPIDLVPCGRRQFYALRRAFFCVLDKRRGN